MRRAQLIGLQLGFALGFYVGTLVVVLAVGEDTFNAAVPNPWRLLISIPAWWAIAVYWRWLTHG